MFPTEYQEPTYNTAIQVVQMIRLLEGRPDGMMKIADMADFLEVHPRTVKRYIEAIGSVVTSATNQPYLERVRKGRTPYAKINRLESDALSITLMEYAALRLATETLDASLPETFGLLHESANDKAQGVFSQDVVHRLRDFENAFVYVPYGPKAYDPNADRVVRKAIDAVIKRYQAEIVYRSLTSDDHTPRKIEPYSIVLYRDALYIYAKQRKPRLPGNKFRYFAVDRIESFDLLVGKTFNKPDTFRADELGKHSLGIWDKGEPQRVILRFFNDGAQYVRERHWPNQISMRNVGDREVELQMDIPVTPEVVAWLAGWGSHVKVVAPDDLVDTLRDYHADALEHYV